MRRQGVVVSKATKADLPRLIEIYSSPELKVTSEEAKWFIECYSRYHHVIVARVGGTIQGACFWRIEGEGYCGLGWVENLWVEEMYRRSGLGEKLLRATIEDMRECYSRSGVRLRRVVLTTQVSRVSARNLYERLGFRSVACLGDLYDDGEYDLFYVLKVAD